MGPTLHDLAAAATKAFPAHSARGRAIRHLVPEPLTSGLVSGYRRYVEQERHHWAPLVSQTVKLGDPLFSVVVPMFNTPDAYLHPLLDSLTNQTFGDFEAIIANASTDDLRAVAIEDATASDPRLRYVRLNENLGISGNTNAALREAKGEYVAFVDHDDMLSPHALNEVAALVLADPAIDILYSDEDVLSDDGLKRQTPFFKPDWSPHMFMECNYTNHLSVVRRSLIAQVGGLRPELDGAQDYDLLLRLHTLPTPPIVVHIPQVLYHWREAATSTALQIGTKTYAIDAGRQALTEYLDRVGVQHDGVDDAPVQAGWYRIRPRWAVSVAVVCCGDAAEHLDARQAATTASTCRPTWLSQPSGFDESALGDAEAVVLISQPYWPDDPTWLDDLVGALTLPGATAVAPLLAGPNGKADSAGYAWDAIGVQSIMQRSRIDSGDFNGIARMVRDVNAVSRAFVAVRRSDIDLLTAPCVPTLVIVPPERGHAVVWGHLCMTRRDGLRRSNGMVSPHVGLGAMGWMRQR